MCALITALDMNLSDRVKALCDVFLDVKDFFFCDVLLVLCSL